METQALEDYIARCYTETRSFVESHPLGREVDVTDPGTEGTGAGAAVAPPPRSAR